MQHFRPVFKRSLDDSWALFFAAPVLTVALAIVVWALNLILQGGKWGFILNALAGLGWTLLSTAIVFGALFLVHFCYLTPKRMIAEADSRLKQAGDRLTTLTSEHEKGVRALRQERDAIQEKFGALTKPKLVLVGQGVSNTETEVRFFFDLKNTGSVSVTSYDLRFTIQTSRMAGPPIVTNERHSQPIDAGMPRQVSFTFPKVPPEPAYIVFHVSYLAEGHERRWDNVPLFFKWRGITGGTIHLGLEYLLDEETDRFKEYLRKHEVSEPLL